MTHRFALTSLAALVVLTGCGQSPSKPPADPPSAPSQPAAPKLSYPAVEPPAPGTPGGLPDDRRPISEAPFSPKSAQGAANVVQTYFALIGEKKYADAWALWADGGKASGMSAAAFADSFAAYDSYAAQIGAPGDIEGAAGSLFVEVPVVIYGRLKTGAPVHLDGPFRLRRVNDVPGSSENERLWHIAASGVRASPRA